MKSVTILAIASLLAGFAPAVTFGADLPSNPCWTVRCSSEFPKCVVIDGSTQCVKDPCADIKCEDGEVCIEAEVQCLQAPCDRIPTCTKDPCAELICNAASTCVIDGNGAAFCLPLPGNPGNPVDDAACAAVTCPIDAPICTILEDGTAACTKDPCADVKCEDGEVCIEADRIPTCTKDPCAELICNAASTCVIDGNVAAFCLPLLGNPGNPVGGLTCAAVTCPIDAPICTILPDGTAECSVKEKQTITGGGTAPPTWWTLVKKNFVGKGLGRCPRRNNVAPVDGSKCSKKKKSKTCFFGNQECAVVGSFPDTRCNCSGGKWKCDSGIDCPRKANEKWN